MEFACEATRRPRDPRFGQTEWRPQDPVQIMAARLIVNLVIYPREEIQKSKSSIAIKLKHVGLSMWSCHIGAEYLQLT